MDAGALDLALPAPGLVVRARAAAVAVAARRFYEQPFEVGTVQPQAAMTISPHRDASPAPWHLHLASAGPYAACAVRA
jgi:hypothetical protein